MADQLEREVAPKDPKRGEETELFDKPSFQWFVAVLMGIVTLAVCAVPIALCLAAFGIGGIGTGSAFQAEPLMTMFGGIIAMFGVLMAGIFVFMAIRIDRGARREARSVAEDAGKEAKRVANEAREKATVIAEGAQRAASESAERVVKGLAETQKSLAAVPKDIKAEVERNFVELLEKAKEEGSNAHDERRPDAEAAFERIATVLGALLKDGRSPNESG